MDATRRSVGFVWCCLGMVVAGGPAAAYGATLTAETLQAFERYVRLTEQRIDQELRGESPFLWVDRLPPAERSRVRRRLEAGETVVARVETRDGADTIDVPDGMIHHWVGTIVIPGAGIDEALALFQAYGRYPEIYAPRVQEAKVLGRDGDRFRVYLRLLVKKILTVVLDTEYEIGYRRLPQRRAHVASRSTRIVELENAGTPAERALPEGRDRGFLWRLNNYCSFEQRAGATYLQCETISLSRAVPSVLGLIIEPFVTSVPRESLSFTLESTRDRLVGTNGS